MGRPRATRRRLPPDADDTEVALPDARRTALRRALPAALLVGIAAVAPLPARAAADSTRVFVEVGAGADVSNQVFYEQTFDSTAFSGRVTVSDPETRVGGLALVRLVAARGRTNWYASSETRAGDTLLRSLARAGVLHETGAHGRVSLDVEADGRRDTSFGLRRDDLRLGGVAAARAYSTDRAWGGRAFVRAEQVRGKQDAGAFALYPDFDWAQAGLDLDRMGDAGTVSLGYSYGARAFPDTSERDYGEHAFSASGLWRAGARWTLDGWGDAARRVARQDSAFGDRLWQGDLEGRVTARAGERWDAGLRSRVRAVTYDEPTPTFFDARIWRHALFARWRASGGLEVEVRPEVEFARTPDFGGLPPDASIDDRRAVAGEEYDEWSLHVDLERFGRAGWWTVAPEFGRRDYLGAIPSADDLSARSGFWYVEVSGFADHRLTGRVTLRGSADVRLERHDVAADDAASLSVAAELRAPLM